jgi:AcrR family transcriptional regulator
MSSQVSESPRQGLNPRQAETVRRLLEAGSAELTERGLDAMTIRTVAHRAGVSPATAYTYLASKDHLLAQLFLRHLQAHPAPEPVPGESVANLRAVVRSMADMLASAPEIAAAATRALLGNDPDVARLRVQIGADYVARFESALGEQAVPEILDTLTFLFTGAMLQAGMGFLSYAEMGDRLETSVQQLWGDR